MKTKLRIFILLLFSVLMSNSCHHRQVVSDCFPGKSLEIGTFPLSKSKYLPASVFKSQYIHDENEVDNGMFSYMQVLKEPSILTGTESEEEVYRFVWIRSFHNPVSIRLQKSLTKVSLIVKESAKRIDDEPTKLIADKSKDVSILQWMKFKSLLEKECFWTIEYNYKEMAIIDGAAWQLEGKRENRYHIVRKASPTKGKFREACLYLLELSDLKITEDDIY